MLNKVFLIGNLGRDPELRYTPSGVALAKFSLATNKYKSGDKEKETTWHNIVCWRKTAEWAADNIKKGTLVFVEGEISKRNWKDKNGVDRVSFEINAYTVNRLSKRTGQGDYNSDDNYEKNKETEVPDEKDTNDIDTEDDVPF